MGFSCVSARQKLAPIFSKSKLLCQDFPFTFPGKPLQEIEGLCLVALPSTDEEKRGD